MKIFAIVFTYNLPIGQIQIVGPNEIDFNEQRL